MESKDKSTMRGERLSLVQKPELTKAFQKLLKECSPGTYISLQAYLNPEPKISTGLEILRNILRDRSHAATTVGFGPRFLHSTGQLHKGGPDKGLFLQFVDQPSEDLAVPEKGYTFGDLIRAQAEGDYQALKSRNRRVLRIDLGEDAAASLTGICRLL